MTETRSRCATLYLSSPVSGREIVRAIFNVIQQPDSSDSYRRYEYSSDGNPQAGFRVGQYSYLPQEQLIVAPSTEEDELHEDGMYCTLTVRTYAWPGPQQTADVSDDDCMCVLTDFAMLLRKQLASVVVKTT